VHTVSAKNTLSYTGTVVHFSIGLSLRHLSIRAHKAVNFSSRDYTTFRNECILYTLFRNVQ